MCLQSRSLIPWTQLRQSLRQLGTRTRYFCFRNFCYTSSIYASNNDEDDDMYEFTPEDCYCVLGPKKQDKVLNTGKFWLAEEAARRSRLSCNQVRFPDNHTWEVTFHPSVSIQLL
ncbi:hypothetical protein ACET3Z_014331 [Daucus carota]